MIRAYCHSILLLCAFLLQPGCSIAFPAGIAKSIEDKNIAEIKRIIYQGKTITLGDHALYLNAKLKDNQQGRYAFKTLQDVVNYAKPGTEQQPTIIYMEPDVYWTDDPNADNKENKLIGLLIPQANITLIGLSTNAEHTIIAGNRGQMAGAIGNWNTIGVADGFKAYNITFGNYCNEDLVYPLDPSKNLPKRQTTITQAQVLTKAHDGEMDKWIFENCRFISYLNTFAAGNRPQRAYYKNCFLQCTDDAVGSGDISIFDRCSFRFYANHPSWGGSRILQAYLGCKFATVLRDPAANSTIFFAKNNNVFAVLDSDFWGNATRLSWTDVPADHVRHYVYNNRLNGKPVQVSEHKPELSVELKGAALAAFKVGDEYNIYNLLRGNDDWDPAGQKERMANFKDLPFRVQLQANKLRLNGAQREQSQVLYQIYPERLQQSTKLNWSVSNDSLLSFSQHADGSITVSAKNTADSTCRVYLKAETEDAIQGLVYFEISGVPQPPPRFSRKPVMAGPEKGLLSVSYELDLRDRKDYSSIEWYRAREVDAKDSIKVAVSDDGLPLRNYQLTTGDMGYYLLAKIRARHNTSLNAEPVTVRSRKISPGDIVSRDFTTDFSTIPRERNSTIRDGFWTVDTYRPKDLSQNFAWTPDPGAPWVYGLGSDATADRRGLMTAGRGARLLYPQAGEYKDMSLVLELSPHKAAGQGFGSATGQYLDIYTKFDARTLTGYGLRIERTPEHGSGVRFGLYKFENGIASPISDQQYSSAFLPGCKIELKVEGSTLSAKVTTGSRQQQAQKDAGLAHELYLKARVQPNSFGGFGVQHTGSTGGASRIMLEKLQVSY